VAAISALLANCQLHGQVAKAAQNPDPAPSVVGFWTGEDMASPQGGKKPTSPEAYYDAAYRGSLTPEVWRVLEDYRVPLYLNVRYGRDFGPVRPGVQGDALALVRKANSLGVPVSAWIVVPYEQGYWAYQGNAQAMMEAVKAWAEWKKANHLKFTSVSIDQEFSWKNLQAYIANVTSHDPEKLTSWMRTNIDPSAQCSAFHTYQELISWAHDHGIRINAAEAPMVADDLADGTLALQNALQIAGSSPGYDQMYLMAYRSAVAQAGFDPGSAYPASYYGSMQKYFGSIGQVSLGIPGQAPYNTITTLVNDVRMLVGLGAREIPIYSLEEMVGSFGPAGIKAVAEAAQHPMQGSELSEAPRPSPAAAGMMGMTKTQDAKASELTLAVTKEHGHSQSPNRWPDGCGSLSVRGLIVPSE